MGPLWSTLKYYTFELRLSAWQQGQFWFRVMWFPIFQVPVIPAGEVDEGGVHTNTEDIDCLECKCDLWMSAIISRQCPGQAACPEHASKLPCRPEDWTLLHRFAPYPP